MRSFPWIFKENSTVRSFQGEKQQNFHVPLFFADLSRIERTCKDAFLRDALIAATPANKIVFRIHEEAKGYQHVLFEDGCLIVQCKAERFSTNVHDIASCKIEHALPSSGLPIALQKNIRDHDAKLKQHLEKIKQITGQVKIRGKKMKLIVFRSIGSRPIGLMCWIKWHLFKPRIRTDWVRFYVIRTCITLPRCKWKIVISTREIFI